MSKTVHIAVMDYCTGSIHIYKHDFPKGIQDEGIEEWLSENTVYTESMAYYLINDREIEVEYH